MLTHTLTDRSDSQTHCHPDMLIHTHGLTHSHMHTHTYTPTHSLLLTHTQPVAYTVTDHSLTDLQWPHTLNPYSHIHTHTHIHTYIYSLIMLTHSRSHILLRSYRYPYTHLLSHSYTHTQAHLPTHFYSHSYTFIHTHTLIYTPTHTHAYTAFYTYTLTFLHTHSHPHPYTHTLMHIHTPLIYLLGWYKWKSPNQRYMSTRAFGGAVGMSQPSLTRISNPSVDALGRLRGGDLQKGASTPRWRKRR